MKKLSIILLSCLLLVTQNIFAEDVANSTWKREAELGMVVTSGNTETETVNAKVKVVNDREKWRHTVKWEGLKTSDDVNTTAKKVNLTAKSDYKFGKYEYFFGLITYENDKFSGFDYQTSEAIGYGRRVIHAESVFLDLEIGPGARQSKLETGETESEAIVRAGANLEWTVSKTSKFTENLTIESGEDSTISKSVSALTSQIAGSLAMKLSLTVKNNSEVPIGVEETDTETAITLVYSF